MYGKHFASMYTGSMMGKGSPIFAVWGFVIANMKPDKVVGCQVELNPKYLKAVIGDSIEVMQKAIEFLCSPDPESRSPEEDGRRLVKIGQYDYRVVNGLKYLEIRNEEERREKARIRQRKHRGKPLPGEAINERSVRNGRGEIDPNDFARDFNPKPKEKAQARDQAATTQD